ncbi:hypothetical protein JOB18_009350 [Solea senegalensis]|uniref:Uncharacterized protein n=1 Tax=Solea senegalensis TaxID=28829 RepID=A0AAV6RG83_SOLSE|nr:hypothetical protein JOB18_009350 [Solea senegalensis]
MGNAQPCRGEGTKSDSLDIPQQAANLIESGSCRLGGMVGKHGDGHVPYFNPLYLSRFPEDLSAIGVVVMPCHYGAMAATRSGPGKPGTMSSIHQRLLPEREGLHQQLRHTSADAEVESSSGTPMIRIFWRRDPHTYLPI